MTEQDGNIYSYLMAPRFNSMKNRGDVADDKIVWGKYALHVTVRIFCYLGAARSMGFIINLRMFAFCLKGTNRRCQGEN